MQMSTYRKTDTTVAYTYSETLFRNTKEWTTNVHNKKDKTAKEVKGVRAHCMIPILTKF